VGVALGAFPKEFVLSGAEGVAAFCIEFPAFDAALKTATLPLLFADEPPHALKAKADTATSRNILMFIASLRIKLCRSVDASQGDRDVPADRHKAGVRF